MMDATQKRKVWKAAICCFLLSTLVFVNYIVNIANSSEFWLWIFYRLQPGFFLFNEAVKSKQSFAVDINQAPDLFVGITSFLSISIWSLCFGWVYAKAVNWLNHFPVLGRRVF